MPGTLVLAAVLGSVLSAVALTALLYFTQAPRPAPESNRTDAPKP